MTCANPTSIHDFSDYVFRSGGSERTVYHRGPNGRPGVVLLHELPGMVRECVEFARKLSRPSHSYSAYRVYMPLLFGSPEQKGGKFDQMKGAICMAREMRLMSASKRSPITAWVADLTVDVARRTGRDRVGVIGMCLTGTLVFGLVAEPTVGAVVASQPSLPFPCTERQKRSVGMPIDELGALAERGCPALAMRYRRDWHSPRQRIESLAGAYGETLPDPLPDAIQDEQLGNLRVVDIPGDAHALLTLDESSHAVDAVREFLDSSLNSSP